ncbi:transcription initiation factor IIB family protein [Candidatus Woesearchaeota archaeon]|nr:transcription initiation factor IIB family protein [Candidatus Woesearchaeota archaeon]
MSIQTEKCPECGCADFFVNKRRGEVICRQCSCVLDDSLVDFGRDWSMDEDSGDTQSRAGAPFDPRVANNLITEIGNSADFSRLDKSTKFLMNRIKKKNRWTSSSLEANLNYAFNHLKTVASHLHVTEGVEKEAAGIYRAAAERGLTKARASDSLVAAALFIACKLFAIPKTMKEVSESSKIDLKTLGKSYKLLLRELKLKTMPTNPMDYLVKYASNLAIANKTQVTASNLIKSYHAIGKTSGKNPTSLAAVALYIASLQTKEKITQKRISEAAGITETTLRNRCAEMLEALKIRLPKGRR